MSPTTRITSTAIAGEDILVGNALWLDDTGGANAGEAFKADRLVTGVRVAGFATAAALTGDPVTYAVCGVTAMRLAAAPAATDNGKALYLGATGLVVVGATTAPLAYLGTLTGANGVTVTPDAVISNTIMIAASP